MFGIKNGLTITPNVNLVSNIGFGDHATHTKDKNSKFSNMSVNSLGNLTHPKKVERNYLADLFNF